MGLFSFLFGKKKKEASKPEELKKITTFEIVENKEPKQSEVKSKPAPVIVETREAITEEKLGEPTEKKIVSGVNEKKDDLKADIEKKQIEELKKPAPIEIDEKIDNTEEKIEQNKVSTTKVQKKATPRVHTPEVVEEPAAAPQEDVADVQHDATSRVGKFEIKKAKDGRYVFNLYASNHVIVATSQIYSSAQSALVGIKSIIANAEKSPIEDTTLKSYEALPYPKWEIYLDKSEHYRFRLYASNGSCVVHSQGYTSKANCKKGIESIMKCAPTAEIDKSYLKKPQ